uniref:Uncharacterized protein n=1 Tax=Odontella aurita TaxID=265563 RepID=A0A7S4MUY7_9STRA|mmetsp:Transcript_34163/g.102186  ORF Transcript_34163/g.102186 Transcript_34163/m.102186 type:complete len:144 (+) Transcript_34163:720-1151(+)
MSPHIDEISARTLSFGASLSYEATPFIIQILNSLPSYGPSSFEQHLLPQDTRSLQGCSANSDHILYYYTWEDLADAIENGCGGTFRLLPTSFLIVSKPLVVGDSDAIIQCGESEKNCFFFTGFHPFEIRGGPGQISLVGVTVA